jgi:regulator of RNase E activity RraA
VGTLTHGGIRDLTDVDALGFYFFSTEVMVSRAECHLVERNTSVEVCGLTVHPGDLIHADIHGAVVIPAEVAPKLAEACRRVTSAELLVLEPGRRAIESGERPTVEQVRQWREQMIKLR